MKYTVNSLILIIGILFAGHARAEQGFIGLKVQAISPEIAESLQIKDRSGVLVLEIATEGPAALAGFHRGDLIFKFGEKQIVTFQDLLDAVKQTIVGKEVSVFVLRELDEVNLRLVPTAWPEGLKVSKSAVSAMPELGLSLASLTAKVRKNFMVRWGAMGVLVSLVDPTIAPNISLQRGDIIVQINQKKIWKPEQVLIAYQEAQAAKISNLLLLVERARSFRFMLLPISVK